MGSRELTARPGNGIIHQRRSTQMVEKKSELKRRRHRRAKILKLKSRLAMAKDGKDRELIVKKIRRISPMWTES
jgi:hypothetical protein